MTLTTTNGITGGTAGVEYTLSGDTNGATFDGCEGVPYSFTTIATPAAGYWFSTPVTGLNVTGTVTAAGGPAKELSLSFSVRAVRTFRLRTIHLLGLAAGGSA